MRLFNLKNDFQAQKYFSRILECEKQDAKLVFFVYSFDKSAALLLYKKITVLSYIEFQYFYIKIIRTFIFVLIHVPETNKSFTLICLIVFTV